MWIGTVGTSKTTASGSRVQQMQADIPLFEQITALLSEGRVAPIDIGRKGTLPPFLARQDWPILAYHTDYTVHTAVA